MTPTDKDKLGFFAAYLTSRCEVEINGESLTSERVVDFTVSNYHFLIRREQNYRDTYKLRLRSIESLTEDEYLTVLSLAYYQGRSEIKPPMSRALLQSIKSTIYHWHHNNNYPATVADYLRDIEVLVGYKQYTPEQLIEMGWVTIKTN